MPCLEFRRVLRSEEHTSELQSHSHLVCRLLLEKKEDRRTPTRPHADLYPRLRAPVGADRRRSRASCFFFNDTATTEIYTLSLHDALPINDTATTEIYTLSLTTLFRSRWSPYHSSRAGRRGLSVARLRVHAAARRRPPLDQRRDGDAGVPARSRLGPPVPPRVRSRAVRRLARQLPRRLRDGRARFVRDAADGRAPGSGGRPVRGADDRRVRVRRPHVIPPPARYPGRWPFASPSCSRRSRPPSP